MIIGWRTKFLVMVAALVAIGPPASRADIVVNGSLAPNGDVGFITSNNVSITFGDGQGSVYQMDGFVNAPGKDLGAGSGQSADLGNGAPTGLSYTFSDYNQTPHQLVLSYTFTNNSGSSLAGFQFLYFIDADIGTNYANESASVHGNLAFPNPTSYQVGDPSTSSIFTNLMNGTLNNVNSFPSPTEGNVSMALGFSSGTLAAGQSITYNVLLADDGTHLGNFYINQTDPILTNDVLTVSGSVVPEPASIVSMTVGGLMSLGYLVRRRVRRRQA